MNPVLCFRSSINLNSRSAGRIKAAEQELAAFFNAVKQLFGREQAELSAKDWLDELARIDGLPSSTRDWRSSHRQGFGSARYPSERFFFIN